MHKWHKPVSVSSMIKDNRLILRAPTEPVVKANTQDVIPAPSIFNTDKLSESFQYYALNDSEQDASSLNLTLDAEQKVHSSEPQSPHLGESVFNFL
ncbi:MAG: hypothetical protein LRY30_00415 [Gammaproteobacteria bacterium]|nr:hypothetical protein [Gammaproteobacteria bacterium]